MDLVWWLVLCWCFICVAGGKGGAPAMGATPAPPSISKTVSGTSDFFPYKLPGQMIRARFPASHLMWYLRPGYASIYPTFTSDFDVYLHPPKLCQAVYLCFTTEPQRTNRGYSGIDINSACKDSLRFLTMEQMVYHFKGGTPTPYVYVSSLVEFVAKDDNGTFTFEAFADFDNENIEDAQRTEVEFSIDRRIVLVLTSSPYCHALLFMPTATTVTGERLQIEPDTDMSNYYKVLTTPKPSPYVVSGSMAGSQYKTAGNRSEMYDIIANQKVSDDDQCCPSTTSFGPVITGDEWSPTSVKAIANSYILEKQKESYCVRKKNALTSPLMSFMIEIGNRCEWMRICFDKTEKVWCEHEGNVINILFYHEILIPTDTDQAEPLALGYGRINKIRVNFLFNEPAIEFGYSFVGANPMVTRNMHLKSYEDVGMDPGKLFLHVVKDGQCRGRLLSDMIDEDFTNAPDDAQCLVVSGCECYKYD